VAELQYPGAHVESAPDRVAYRMAGSGETLTFAELDARANQLARLLRARGLGIGGHVVIGIENRIEAPLLMWGAHYAGLYYTFVSTRLTADEVAYVVRDTGTGLVVLSARQAAEWGAALREALPAVEVVSSEPVPGLVDLVAEASGYAADPLPGAVEGVDMLYSSGTTGYPKGVKRPLTGLPLGSSTRVTALAQALLGADDASVYLSPAPFYHAAPLMWCKDMVAMGASVVIMERFDAEDVLAAIERHHVTHSQFVPTMFIRLLRLPAAIRDKYDWKSLNAAIHAAAPCPEATKRAMLDWWGPVVHEYYAGTEGNGFCWCTPQEWLAHPGSVGRPLLGIVHVLGADGQDVATGDEGVVYFEKGAPFEYHNDPEKTAESRNDAGWTTMGDIGRLDPDGYLYLTDRLSNTIITGGVNVYPQEAENVLAVHDKVFDVAVIGVPDHEFGEQVKAVVQPADGIMPSADLEAELIAYCRARLADIKCPRSVDFRSELPRLPNGKLLKRLLRDEYRTVDVAP
jgi:long-chain acyl-CoA synthetase